MPEKHALLSASGSHKWLNCTPSARLEENYENITSSYMEEGTLAHALAELKLRKTYTTLSTRKYNSELKKIQENEMYNNEMEEATDKYKTLIDEIMYGAKEKPFIEIEKQIDYGNWAKEGFGTTDCVIIENNILPIGISKEKLYEVIIKEEIYTWEEAISKAIEISKKKLLENNNKIIRKKNDESKQTINRID